MYLSHMYILDGRTSHSWAGLVCKCLLLLFVDSINEECHLCPLLPLLSAFGREKLLAILIERLVDVWNLHVHQDSI